MKRFKKLFLMAIVALNVFIILLFAFKPKKSFADEERKYWLWYPCECEAELCDSAQCQTKIVTMTFCIEGMPCGPEWNPE